MSAKREMDIRILPPPMSRADKAIALGLAIGLALAVLWEWERDQ